MFEAAPIVILRRARVSAPTAADQPAILLHPASQSSRMCQLFQALRPCFDMTGIRCRSGNRYGHVYKRDAIVKALEQNTGHDRESP
jgi:hypothetical protein